MVKKLSCVSHGSLKRFPHTFTSVGSEIREVQQVCMHFVYYDFVL